MTWTVVIYGMVPLAVFVLVDTFSSLKWAVISAIAFAVFDVILSYYTLKTLDPGRVFALLLLCVFGAMALRTGNPRWVKLQPVVLSAGFAVFVGYFQFFGQPLLERYMPLVMQASPPEAQTLFSDPNFMSKMNRAVTGLIFVLLAHGALVWYAAYKMSTVAWLVIRGIGFWVLLVVMVVGVMVF